MEYTGPVGELKEMCEIRIEVAGILRDCRVSIWSMSHRTSNGSHIYTSCVTYCNLELERSD